MLCADGWYMRKSEARKLLSFIKSEGIGEPVGLLENKSGRGWCYLYRADKPMYDFHEVTDTWPQSWDAFDGL